MKRSFSRWIPGWLQRCDQWLLRQAPVVWRTYVHYVLLVGFVATVVFYLIGLYTPQIGRVLKVDPIHPIVIHEEAYYFFVFAIIGLLAWAYQLYRRGLPSMSLPNALITIVCLASGTFFFLGTTSVAYHMGVVTHTAYKLMEEEDYDVIKENDYFAYGLLFLAEDSIPTENPTDSFLAYREGLFRQLVRTEDSLLLTSRYYYDTLVPHLFPNIEGDKYVDNNRHYLSTSVYNKELQETAKRRLNLPFLAHFQSSPDTNYTSFDTYIGMRYTGNSYSQMDTVIHIDTLPPPTSLYRSSGHYTI